MNALLLVSCAAVGFYRLSLGSALDSGRRLRVGGYSPVREGGERGSAAEHRQEGAVDRVD